MTKQLFIYDNVVPLNREVHKEHSVAKINDMGFAANVNAIPVMDVEFLQTAAEMPILFTKVADGYLCLAMLGAEKDKNAFVTEDGKWDGQYVPAFFRRYPFVFAKTGEDDTLTLCIDEGFSGLNTDGVGERLFDSTGAETGYTQNVIKFTEEFQTSSVRTQAFCKRLEELELLEQSRVDYTLEDGSRGSIDGFFRVNAEKMRALDDADVLALFRAGHLDLIHMHLMSLQRVQGLISRRNGQGGAAAPEPQGETQEAGDA